MQKRVLTPAQAEAARLRDRAWYAANRERARASNRAYRLENREKIREKNRVYRLENREKGIGYHRDYRLKNREKIIEYQRAYHLKNLEKMVAYRLKNQERIAQQRRHRYYTVPAFNICCKLRMRLYFSLRQTGANKAAPTRDLLGCSLGDFRVYFEKLFTEGMSWEKVLSGDIHVDHVKPCCKFNLLDPAQQKECFHYTNLQPLWAVDNRTKGAKYG